MIAIILAGGRGSRLGHLTSDCPKPLLKIGNRPFIEIILNQISGSGLFRDIYILTGYLADKFIEFESDFKKLVGSATLHLEREPFPLGTGGAIKNLLHHKKIGGEAIVLNGDTFFNLDLPHLIQRGRQFGGATLSVTRMDSQNGRFREYTLLHSNKLALGIRNLVGTRVVNGGYIYFEEINQCAVGEQDCYGIEQVLSKFENQDQLHGCLFETSFLDIGIPEDFKQACTSFKR